MMQDSVTMTAGAEKRATTGYTMRVPKDVRTTAGPNAEELRAVREYDKEGFWTK